MLNALFLNFNRNHNNIINTYFISLYNYVNQVDKTWTFIGIQCLLLESYNIVTLISLKEEKELYL